MGLTRILTAADLEAETLAALRARAGSAIEALIEETAKARGYADATRLATYTNSVVPEWADEATQFLRWRDEVWVTAYSLLADAENGVFEPSLEAVMAALPVIVWEPPPGDEPEEL